MKHLNESIFGLIKRPSRFNRLGRSYFAIRSRNAGLVISGIESVNIHDSIKVGTPDREQYIENYIQTLENLGKEDLE